MPEENKGPNIARSALVIVDMQNDFLQPDGSFAHIAREHPEAMIDMPFLAGTIPHVKRLSDAFRAAGRPVVYIAHVLKSDYSDAAFPFWRLGLEPGTSNRTHCVEGTWGAEIIDELAPHEGEHVVVKKGFGGFANTSLDGVCVSNTICGGVEHNYRIILVRDAAAEVSRDAHDSELKTMNRVFADVKTTDEVVELLSRH